MCVCNNNPQNCHHRDGGGDGDRVVNNIQDGGPIVRINDHVPPVVVDELGDEHPNNNDPQNCNHRNAGGDGVVNNIIQDGPRMMTISTIKAMGMTPN